MRKVTYNSLMRNKTIKNFLTKRLGEEGLVLIEMLFKAKRFVSEFTLAERSAIYVNTVRSLMYKLYENKIVTYSRKREKTRGWYIYSWKFHPQKLVSFLIKQLKKEKRKLNNKLESQSADKYFYCKECDIKLQFTEAMEYNFSCPNCFKQMKVTSPAKENKKLKKEIKKTKKEIESLKRLMKRLKWMEKKRREAEKRRKEREEAERKRLADKGMYFCTECNHAHKFKSKIGKKHKKHAK